MRLLMVTTSFPPVVGGLQTYALELALELDRACERLAVVAPWQPGAGAQDRRLPFQVIRLPEIGDDLALSGILPLAAVGRMARWDVAFGTHWAAAHAALRARVARRVVTAAHGKELLLRPLKRVPGAQAVYDAVRRSALARSDRFFPVSSYTARLLLDAGVDPARITVVHNGVDAERFCPLDGSELRAELGAADRRVLLTVARLVPRKGIDTTLEALPAVAERVPDVLYLVVGDGPDRGRLEALARRLGVSDRTRFLGKVGGDIARWYAAADLFVMPAREEAEDAEGFGLVFLEAGACERAVVGARAGGAVDAVVHGETGLMVPPEDPAALAAALTELLEDPARRQRLGQAARRRVLASGTWDHAARRILEALRD